MRAPAALVACLLMLVGVPTDAQAKAQVSVSYKLEQVWPAALRLLRVDEKLTIVDLDRG